MSQAVRPSPLEQIGDLLNTASQVIHIACERTAHAHASLLADGHSLASLLRIEAAGRACADGIVFAVSTSGGRARMSTARTVVAVSTQPQHAALLHMLVAEVGGYDVIQVASLPTAYSRVREVAPELVVVMLSIDDADACQLLSMLALDERTSHIPVVSCTFDPDTGGVDAVLVGNAGDTSADVLAMELH